MKANHISILIISVIAGLVVLCCVFPSGGINLGFTQLRFPGLIEALEGDSTDFIDPEEQMARLEQEQLAMQHAKQDSSFLARINKSETRIWFPGDDPSYLDAVFAALDNAGNEHMRIIHYGDSQIELDRISCGLREHLQTTFGGNGRGWIPVVPIVGSYTAATYCSPLLRQGIQYSYSDETKPRSRKGGPYATTAYLDGGSVTVTANANEKAKEQYGHVHGFNRVKVVSGNNNATLTVSCGNAKATVAPNQSLTVTTLDIDSTSNVRVNISGRAHLYGILLDSPTGVSVDNVPMRGCTGTIFTSLAKEELTDFFKQENVPLIILQFGGNVVPLISEKNLEGVINQLRSQLEFFKEVATNSRILFIGPSDMATRKGGGGMHTYKNLPMYIDALKAMCLEAGVAYWDMYAVMGGNGSMVSWVNNGWAGSDYIHFSTKGAERMAGILTNTFMLYYDYYTFRQEAIKKQEAVKSKNAEKK